MTSGAPDAAGQRRLSRAVGSHESDGARTARPQKQRAAPDGCDARRLRVAAATDRQGAGLPRRDDRRSRPPVPGCLTHLGIDAETFGDIAEELGDDHAILAELRRRGIPTAEDAWFDAIAFENSLHRC